MMEARLILMAVVCLCIAQMALAKNQDFSFTSIKKEQQYIKIIKSVRCPICQTQSLFESNTSTSHILKQEIYDLYVNDTSVDNIYNFLRDQYGDDILFTPRVNAKSASLWIIPFLLIGGTIVYLLRQFNRRTFGTVYA